MFGAIPLVFNFWDEFDYKQLTINCRQKDDSVFSELLNRIRIGMPTNEDIEMLENARIPNKHGVDKIKNAAMFYVENIKKYPQMLALFPKTSSVDQFNNTVSSLLKIETHTIEAVDSNPNQKLQFKAPNYKSRGNLKAKKRKTNETAGLEQILKIGINSRVILKRNIDVDRGLVNGALGLVKSFIFESNDKTKIKTVMIKFDKLNEIVGIERISAEYEYQKNIYVARSQFPLSLSWALTIHKSQGLTLDCLLVDLGSDIFEGGQAYVALSRCKSLNNLHIIDIHPQSIYCKHECVLEYNRLIKKFIPNGELIKQWNVLPSKYTPLNSIKKVTRDLVSQYEKTTFISTINQSKAKSKANIVPILNKQTSQKIISNNNLPENQVQFNSFLKLRNSNILFNGFNQAKFENACFANSITQALLSLGAPFIDQVTIII